MQDELKYLEKRNLGLKQIISKLNIFYIAPICGLLEALYRYIWHSSIVLIVIIILDLLLLVYGIGKLINSRENVKAIAIKTHLFMPITLFEILYALFYLVLIGAGIFLLFKETRFLLVSYGLLHWQFLAYSLIFILGGITLVYYHYKYLKTEIKNNPEDLKWIVYKNLIEGFIFGGTGTFGVLLIILGLVILFNSNH